MVLGYLMNIKEVCKRFFLHSWEFSTSFCWVALYSVVCLSGIRNNWPNLHFFNIYRHKSPLLSHTQYTCFFLVSCIPRNQSNNQPRNQPTIQTICYQYGFRIFDEQKRSGQTIFLTFLGVLNFFLLFSVLVLDEGHCRTE